MSSSAIDHFLRGRASDPFFLDPQKFHTINVSGGRTSAYMLRKILDRYDGRLPDNAVAVFANTGKEYDETLDFVRDMEILWGVPIIWLEFFRDESARGVKGEPKNTFRFVTWETANRSGGPFLAALRARKAPPNVHRRFCTTMLKVNLISQWSRFRLHWKKRKTLNILGIRRDEERRLLEVIAKDCEIRQPLAYAGTTKEDVLGYWKESRELYDFDLRLEPHQSNCDLCFLKGRGLIMKILREEPWRADWWKEAEEAVRDKRKKGFRDDALYSELSRLAKTDFFAGAEESRKTDCFCGD